MISPILTSLVVVDLISAVAVISAFLSAISVILAFLSATLNHVSIISILVVYLVIIIRSRGFRYGKNLWN